MESLNAGEIAELIEDAPIAHVGVLHEGRPYVTPMSYVVIDEVFYFRTAAGRRLDCIKKEAAVCLEICRYDASSGHWSSVVVTGEATVVTDPDVDARVSQAILHKYRGLMGSPLGHPGVVPPMMQPFVVAVRPIEVTGFRSGSGLSPGLRPGRL
jgi:nitroimidazol reductase NimA-like FMN-containing flavoprotein (pyridoxamine 5'-phosphate oxidase superfamily)